MALRPAAEDHDVALRRLLEHVVHGPGALDEGVRARAARGEGDGPAGAFVQGLASPAGRVGAAEVEALRRAGWTDDEVFELAASAALGLAKRRLEAGLRALQDAEAPAAPAPEEAP